MRRVYINLGVFAVLATVTIAWSITSLFSIDQLDKPYTVTAEFESSPGLAPGFEVTYLGTGIGSVKSVDLQDGKSVIELKIRKDVELPAQLNAAASRKSAIGEPYVNLFPTPDTDPDAGPRLKPGDVIPLDRTTVPISYAEMFASVESLIDAVDPDQLEILLRETALALDGRGDELRTLVVGAKELTDDLVVHADEIDRFLADMGSLASTAARHRDSIETSLDSLTAVADSLSDLEGPIDSLLAEAPPMVAVLTTIIEEGDAGLLCTLEGLAVLEQVATPEILQSLRNVLQNSSDISRILDAVIHEDGYLHGDVTIGGLEGNPSVYPEQVAQPVAPDIPGCEDFATEFVPTGGSDRADVGAGGEGAFPTDGSIEVPGVTDDVDAGLAGSSDLDEPEESLLARLFRLAVPAVAVALLALLGWVLLGVVRNRRNT